MKNTGGLMWFGLCRFSVSDEGISILPGSDEDKCSNQYGAVKTTGCRMINSAAAWPVLASSALPVRGTLHSRPVRFTGHREICACQCETRVALRICGIIMRRYHGQRMQRFLQT